MCSCSAVFPPLTDSLSSFPTTHVPSRGQDENKTKRVFSSHIIEYLDLKYKAWHRWLYLNEHLHFQSQPVALQFTTVKETPLQKYRNSHKHVRAYRNDSFLKPPVLHLYSKGHAKKNEGLNISWFSAVSSLCSDSYCFIVTDASEGFIHVDRTGSFSGFQHLTWN